MYPVLHLVWSYKLRLAASQLEYCWLHSFQKFLPVLWVQWGPHSQNRWC